MSGKSTVLMVVLAFVVPLVVRGGEPVRKGAVPAGRAPAVRQAPSAPSGVAAEADRRARLRMAKAAQKQARAKAQQKAAQQQAEFELRMAPILAAQAEAAARMQYDQARAAALSQMAESSRRQTEINAARLRLQSQALGQPQILTREGWVPYRYGVARPIGR